MSDTIPNEDKKLKLAGIVSDIAQNITEGQTVANLAAVYKVDVKTMQELVESPQVVNELHLMQFKSTKKKATLSGGWSGLEVLCVEGLIDQVTTNDLTTSELVQITRVALEAQKSRGDVSRPIQAMNQSVTLSFNSGVKPTGAVATIDAVKVESVLPQGEVKKLFDGDS
ncbi:MAG: hypothetical protein L3J05_05840 [Robiginitomaculum sp.]|nr:hypothetical protein [Robiginitomaculum sp.]